MLSERMLEKRRIPLTLGMESVMSREEIATEVAALESDIREAYGKMNVLIQREKAHDKLVAALEAQVARLTAEKSEMECVMDETAHSLHHALSAMESLDA